MHKEEGEKLIVLAKSTTSGGREARVEDFDHLERGRPSVEDFDVEVFDVTYFDSSDRRGTSVENFDRKKSKTEKQIGVENFGFFTKESTKRRALNSWSSWSFSLKPTSTFQQETVREVLGGEDCDFSVP